MWDGQILRCHFTKVTSKATTEAARQVLSVQTEKFIERLSEIPQSRSSISLLTRFNVIVKLTTTSGLLRVH